MGNVTTLTCFASMLLTKQVVLVFVVRLSAPLRSISYLMEKSTFMPLSFGTF